MDKKNVTEDFPSQASCVSEPTEGTLQGAGCRVQAALPIVRPLCFPAVLLFPSNSVSLFPYLTRLFSAFYSQY